ncbi:MAG: histidine kinase dimerization/phosphoacceptor domain -containing protein [Cyanobacteria bacterium P01_G01_bin.19]
MPDNSSPEISSYKQEQELEIARLKSQIHKLTAKNQLLEQQLSEKKCDSDPVHFGDRNRDRTESIPKPELHSQFWQTALEQIPGGVIIAEAPSGKCLFTNNFLAKIFRREITPINIFADYVYFGLLEDDHSMSPRENCPLVKAIDNHPVLGEEMKFLCGDGVIRTLVVNAVPIYDAQGSIISAIATFYDLTDVRQVQLAQQEATNKSIFLKEIHHRVKNNLQVISALLDLQSEQVRDREAYSLLEKSQARIQTMALIHDKLYSSDNIEQIGFSDYVSALTRYLHDSFVEDYNHIELILNIEPITLSINLAMPCGLIINELVTNSLQHGFKRQKIGKVQIDFCLDRNNQYILQISDNGLGINSTLNIKDNPEFLGMSIVESLVTEQLKGTWNSYSIDGYTIQITFPKQPYLKSNTESDLA